MTILNRDQINALNDLDHHWGPAEIIDAVETLKAQARHLDRLAAVGQLYLKAIDEDPDNEMLTLPDAMWVTDIRDAVEFVGRR